MHIVSQIIEKNLYRGPGADAVLWINPEKDVCWRKLHTANLAVQLFCQAYGSYQYHRQAGGEVEFAAFPGSHVRGYPWIILRLSRQKALFRMLLEYAASLLTQDGVLWLVGENKAGIKSADKHLRAHFRQVNKLDNARHCTLYEAVGPLQEAAFDHVNYKMSWPLECGDHRHINIHSYPGVFAHGRLDAGSALLLEALAGLPLSGKVLDFACGAGVIGCFIAARYEQSNVTFLDTSALALMACGETLSDNHLQGTLLASDGLSGAAHDFDVIVTNPPIHAGVRTNNRLGQQLLSGVYEHLRPGGRLIMVANIHLPYEKGLRQQFSRYHEIMSNTRYKVISASK